MDITQSIFTPGQGEFQRLMIETNVGGGTELAPWLLRRPFPDHPPFFTVAIGQPLFEFRQGSPDTCGKPGIECEKRVGDT